jgi:hypothetical protein
MPKPASDNTRLDPCNLVEGNLGSCLGVVGIFVKGAVCTVFLLLDSCTKLHQVFWYGLVGCLEDIDQPKNRVSSLA